MPTVATVTPVKGNALDRAGRIYQRNPKLVATVGAAALALIAAGLSRRRRF